MVARRCPLARKSLVGVDGLVPCLLAAGSMTTGWEGVGMSYVIAAPEIMASAATDVAAVGSTLSAAHMAAAAPTVAVIPAAADEVSASIAHLFSRYANDYQAVAGRAAAFHEQFAQQLTASARSFATTEAASTASLHPLSATGNGELGVSLNSLTTIFDKLKTRVTTALEAFYLLAYLNYLIAFFEYILIFFAIEIKLFKLLGVTIPFPPFPQFPFPPFK
jgi:PE family